MTSLAVEARDVAQDFSLRFGRVGVVSRAPDRVNLIGEHTDYDDGFVMPAALDFAALVAGAPPRPCLFDRHGRDAGASRYSVSTSSSLTPRPWRRLLRACSIRLKNRGSCSRRYSNQSSSEFEADQHARRFAVARDDDFLRLRLSKKSRQIILDLGKRHFPHSGLENCASHDSASDLVTTAKTSTVAPETS